MSLETGGPLLRTSLFVEERQEAKKLKEGLEFLSGGSPKSVTAVNLAKFRIIYRYYSLYSMLTVKILGVPEFDTCFEIGSW